MKIAVIPIDNRPICYDLIYDVLSIDKNIELFMPDIKSLGGLKDISNTDMIFDFLINLEKVDYLIVSLDTLAYGGLISSRRCDDKFDEIKERIEKFKKIASEKAGKILAFSSVMRISNNNINEEEKIYWAQWGKKIFDWSYNIHKSKIAAIQAFDTTDIPEEILNDYLNTRKRNFEINKIYLDWAKEGFFDTLIFSKDDCAQYGLNVVEALELQKIINENKIDSAFIKTGADEIPLGLISRAICKNKDIKIKPLFQLNESTNLISKYEDVSISDCVKGQIDLAGCKLEENNPDMVLFINNFEKEQGDHVLNDIVNCTSKKVDFPLGNYFIADVNNANGADCALIEQLFGQLFGQLFKGNKGNTDNFFGYCGYNTSANTIGCAIFCAVVKFLAQKNNSYNENAFKKFQFIRFLDDWAYQAISRKFVRESYPKLEYSEALKEKIPELNQNAKKISEFLDFYPQNADYSLPWARSFEIRVKISDMNR